MYIVLVLLDLLLPLFVLPPVRLPKHALPDRLLLDVLRYSFLSSNLPLELGWLGERAICRNCKGLLVALLAGVVVEVHELSMILWVVLILRIIDIHLFL